jgi:hypothetical protein
MKQPKEVGEKEKLAGEKKNFVKKRHEVSVFKIGLEAVFVGFYFFHFFQFFSKNWFVVVYFFIPDFLFF